MSSMYSPTSLFGNAAYDVPTASAWCLWEENGTTPVTIDSAGVSGDVLYLSRGVRRIRFQNQNRFSSGGYVGFGLYENGNKAVATPTNNHAVLQMHGTTANSDVTNSGSSAACDVCVIGFDGIGSSTTYKNSLADANSTYKVRGNAVFFSFRADSDSRKPYIANCVRYSESFDQWTNVGSTETLVTTGDTLAPASLSSATKIWKLIPTSGTVYTGSQLWINIDSNTTTVSSTPTSLNSEMSVTGRTYTFSAYFKKAEYSYGQIQVVCLSTNQISTAFRVDTGAFVGAVSSTGSWSGVTRTITNAGNGWYRVSVSGKWTGANNAIIRVYLNGGDTSGGNGTSGILVTGAQFENGSSATPYIKTEASVPVYGDQELLINRNPDSTGYAGTTGATFSSHIAPFSVDPKLRATAWGTIVIPGVSGDSSSSVYTYLEDRSSRVVGVSAGKGVFTVLLDPPMGTTSYCVVACAEQEQYYGSETTAAAGSLGSIPPKEEFPILMIQNNDVNVPDDSRTKTSFTIKSLRQTTNYGSFLESNDKYMTTAGLNTRIHFLVFGGLTAYA